LIKKLGKTLKAEDLKGLIDFAFLALHGANGEDGTIQGLLEFMDIPYSGSGIMPSALGMNKRLQKQLMQSAGMNVPKYLSFQKSELHNLKNIYKNVKQQVGFPFVVKPANQGSSVGVSVINNDNFEEFENAVIKSFFIQNIISNDWINKDEKTKTEDHVYFMTVDVSRGQNQDYSAFVVVDITTMPYKVVAKFKNNLISPLLLPSYVFSVGKKYNNAYILVETNDVGSQVADILYTDLEYENLIKSNYKGNKGQIITEFKGTSSNLGVRTTLPVKKLGCSVLKNLIETDKLLTEDPDIVNELTTFIADGKSFAAEEGHNDDLVMCLVLFSWASRQNFFENLTSKDVRVEMFKNEILQIEKEVLSFMMQDGHEDDLVDEQDKWEEVKRDRNSISTQLWLF
jgi:hypothetical protein